MEAVTTQPSSMITMDLEGNILIPRAGAIVAAILRIGIGFIYLWGFLTQGFGIGYTNRADDTGGYAWPSATTRTTDGSPRGSRSRRPRATWTASTDRSRSSLRTCPLALPTSAGCSRSAGSGSR